MRRTVRASLHAGALLAVTGVVAWATGRPFVFPSLGPSAYVLATARGPGEGPGPRRVVGAHVVGVLAGLLAYHLLASGLSITAGVAPFAPAGVLLGASAVLSVALTAAGMLATDAVHPPACATTLIVSLGVLPSVADGATIVAAVVVLVAADSLANRVRGEG